MRIVCYPATSLLEISDIVSEVKQLERVKLAELHPLQAPDSEPLPVIQRDFRKCEMVEEYKLKKRDKYNIHLNNLGNVHIKD